MNECLHKNCHAGDIDHIEYGKPKDDQGLPIFSLAIAYDKNNRVPLFYVGYLGAITDVSQFRYMDDNKQPFVIMVKGQKELDAAPVQEHRNTFEADRNCAI